MWDLIVSVPDLCLSFYFAGKSNENMVTVTYSTLCIRSDLKKTTKNIRPEDIFLPSPPPPQIVFLMWYLKRDSL